MGIKKKAMSSFSKLREWIINQFTKNKAIEEKIILSVLENPLLIEKYQDFNFGFEKLSLPQKFASIDQLDMVIKCLKLNMFDITYEAISGKNLLDYYLLDEDNDIFKEILQCCRKTSSKWLESKTYKREGKLEAIRYENSIINSIENNQTNERMRIVSERFNIFFEEYSKRVENKRSFLIKKNYEKNSEQLKEKNILGVFKILCQPDIIRI